MSSVCFGLSAVLLLRVSRINMALQKRKRSANWMASEKNLLIDIVSRHFGIIENKKTDGMSMKQKLDEWKIISEEYNSQTTSSHRQPENLKSQWESMKKAAKKESANTSLEIIKTGGGSSNIKRYDPIQEKIMSLIKISAVGLNNPYDNVLPVDSDIIMCNPEVSTISTETLKIEEVDEHEIGDMQTNEGENAETVELKQKDWCVYTPQFLHTPLSEPLQKQNGKWTSGRCPTCNSKMSYLEQLHNKKIEAIDVQKELAHTEIEKNNIIKDLEIKIKKQMLKQEKLKTRILIYELKLKKKEFG